MAQLRSDLHSKGRRQAVLASTDLSSGTGKKGTMGKDERILV